MLSLPISLIKKQTRGGFLIATWGPDVLEAAQEQQPSLCVCIRGDFALMRTKQQQALVPGPLGTPPSKSKHSTNGPNGPLGP
jgi:hypothetical protein